MNVHDPTLETRVLVLMPSAKDTATTCEVLTRAGLSCATCTDVSDFCKELAAGAGVALLTEEVIEADGSGRILEALGHQPSWSDLPLVIITRGDSRSSGATRVREAAGTAILLERPLRLKTLVSVARASLRARLRQYDLRDHIEEQCAAEERLRRSEEALKEADHRKDEFLAMLAHELRNPLAAGGNAILVLKRSEDDEDRQWAAEVLGRQLKQMGRIVEDLLDISRISRGALRLRTELVDAASALDSAVEVVRPLVEEKQQSLNVSCERGTLFLRADPARLEQVVSNLLTNAARYTPAGGHIWLEAGREAADVVVRVRDDGVGIPPDRIPQMFDLYMQGEGPSSRSESGLGLGLTLVRKLVEMHGGTVSATSAGAGRGSEFTVRLPAVSPAPRTARPPRVDPAPRTHGSRILIVDDCADSAAGLARLLSLLGNEVQTALDGPSAVDAADRFQPEFVLLDIGLPGMDGYQVAACLRAQESSKDALIIAISGYGQAEDRTKSRAAGIDHHLVKPVDYETLVMLITQAH